MNSTLTEHEIQTDLYSFHSSHFQSPSRENAAQLQEEPADSADLGYYPDGQPRTLTDDEIAIFRHSEIQALLLQRMKERLEAEDSKPSPTESGELSEGEISDHPDTAAAAGPEHSQGEAKTQNDPDLVKQEQSNSHDVLTDDQDEDEEAEYARFLEQERREFAESTLRKRQKSRHNRDLNNRNVSTRRRIREMDAFESTDPILSYDDGEPPQSITNHSSETPALDSNEEQSTGRTIWWPQIGAKPVKDLYVDAGK